MQSPTLSRTRGVLWLLPALLLLVAACDTADPVEPSEMTIQGHVSTSDAFTTDPTNDEPVQGATVTASVIGANGQLQPLTGSTTTDERGDFLLTVQSRSEALLLEAETDDGFRATAVIERQGAGVSAITPAPPLNVQSTAVADVLLEARSEYDDVRVADAMFYVDAATSGHIQAGDLDIQAAADAVGAGAATEAAFAGATDTGFNADAIAEHRTAAYSQLRHALAGAETADQRRIALDNFFDAYAGAYAEAEVSPLITGRAATAGARSAGHFAGNVGDEFGFALTRSSQLAAGLASAHAIEAEFEAVDADPSTMQALAAARTQMMTDLQEAGTTAEMDDARQAYRATVQTELATQLEIPETVVTAGIEATAAAQTALDTAVAGATTPGAVAQAYGTYYDDAHLAATTALGVEGDFGGNVVTTIAAY